MYKSKHEVIYMAVSNENNGGIPATMLVGPTGGNDFMGGNSGAGFFWMILLFVLFAMCGNGFGGYGNGNNAGMQRGFDQAAVMGDLNGIQSGIQGLQMGMATGFAGVEQGANSRQMADMNQYFQMQTAFQNCCCENRLATVGLNTTISQDGALTRQTIQQGNQAILDKLCQLELDGIKQNYENRIAAMQNTIDQLRDINQNARSAAAFGALGDRFQASQDAQTNTLEQYLAPTPRPAYIVQNPNCCTQNNGCGCA
jgi:hypothetical protein